MATLLATFNNKIINKISAIHFTLYYNKNCILSLHPPPLVALRGSIESRNFERNIVNSGRIGFVAREISGGETKREK